MWVGGSSGWLALRTPDMLGIVPRASQRVICIWVDSLRSLYWANMLACLLVGSPPPNSRALIMWSGWRGGGAGEAKLEVGLLEQSGQWATLTGGGGGSSCVVVLALI